MTPAEIERKRRERANFHELFDLSLDARHERLAQMAHTDHGMALELRRLLDAAGDGTRVDAEHSGRIGETVSDRFKLVRHLGSGGMGDVYLAVRMDAIEKEVAIKFLPAAGTRSRTRADRERQILASLSHPNIASFIDAGVTSGGVQWCAMEFVDGDEIRAWSDKNALSVRERVALFAQVCNAVQFAHSKLVLHRDLKPSNIFVGSDGVPKLLDFGIASWIDAATPQPTQSFTIEYASPEQLRGDAPAIASDIYQLGIVLFELLCGRPSTRCADGAMSDSPLRMPAHLSALERRDPAGFLALASSRSVRGDALKRIVGGDLGRIVSKATAFKIADRYSTAQAFADDLLAFLKGRPISAHRASAVYTGRKLISRHPLAASIILSLIVALVASTAFSVHRAIDERAARLESDEAERRSTTLLAFLRDVVHEADPERAKGASLAPQELVSRAEKRLASRSDLGAALRSTLQVELADIWLSLGHPADSLRLAEPAMRQFSQQRDKFSQDFLRSASLTQASLYELGQYPDALKIISDSSDFAATHQTSEKAWHALLTAYKGASLMALGRESEAETSLRTAIAETQGMGSSKDSGARLFALDRLGALATNQGRTRDSLEIYVELKNALDADPDSSEANRIVNLGNIGGAHIALGEPKSSYQLLKEALARSEEIFGPRYDRSLLLRALIAKAYVAEGNDVAADATLSASDQHKLIELTRELGPDAYWTIRTMRAKLKMRRGEDGALAELNAIVTSMDATKDASVLAISRARAALGEALLRSGQPGPACERLRDVVEIAASDDSKHPPTVVLDAEDSWGRCLLAMGRPDDALVHLRRAYDELRSRQVGQSSLVLRAEVHALWAEFEVNHDAKILTQLSALRDQLVITLGSDTPHQIEQLDRLLVVLRQSKLETGLPEHQAKSGTVDGGSPASIAMTGLDSFFL